VYFRVVRRLVTLVSRLAQVQADFEAAQKQAESASAAARQFMEDKDNKVIELHFQSHANPLELLVLKWNCLLPVGHLGWSKRVMCVSHMLCGTWWISMYSVFRFL